MAPLTHVDGHHGVVTVGADADVRSSIATHVHRVARAMPVLKVAGNDVTVGALGQPGLQVSVERVALQVDGDERLVAAGEGDLIVGA